MTTIAQVKRAVKPLLDRNPDLALVGRTAFIAPVRHILRGVTIDRSSSADLFIPIWAVIFLFEPKQTFSLHWGGDIFGRGLWSIDNPTTPSEMCDAIEREALPLLRRVQSIDDFVALANDTGFHCRSGLDEWPDERLIVDVARGDLDAARALATRLDAERAHWASSPRADEYARALSLKPLIEAGDHAGLARQLHDWEAQSVKNLKIERLWEKTPFPLETQAPA